MTTMTLHPLAARYLEDLRHAGRRLPRSVLRDLVTEIEAHLAETTHPEMSDAEVLTALDRLGDPKEIIAEQEPERVLPVRTRGIHEWAAISLLLFGGFIFGFGWIAGLVLLWSSPLWTTRDKWIGTLVTPGGLGGAFLLVNFYLITGSSSCVSVNGGVEHCTGGSSTVVQALETAGMAILLIGPIATAIYLARRAR